MSNETETTRDSDWVLASRTLRDVLGGESGDLMTNAVAIALHELRNMDPDERDDAAHELADNAVPVYTYQRAQMFAESLFHVTYESELAQPTTDANDLMGTILYEIAHAAISNLIQDEA